jgi:hypothetical protein
VAEEGVEMSDKVQVWSCGGGTQSCAIAALIVQGKLPKPDISVIADTGYETQATWDYMDGTLSPAMKSVGVDLVRVKASEWNPKRATLFYEYADKGRAPDLEIPAFSMRFGTVGKLSNYCTGRWKVETRDKYIRSVHGLTRSKFCVWIGFSFDESSRAIRMMDGEEYKKGLIRFPLIHDHTMTRRKAIELVESMGWKTPPRSACWCCPNHSDHEWRKMKSERPDEFQKAVDLEREIQKRDPDAWLHKSCKPLDQVDFTQPEDLFSRPCDSGMCFV